MTVLNKTDSVDSIVPSAWRAQLDLGFTANNDRTILSHRSHFGPLQVQKPFYPEENGTVHVYILHPPGGVVGGDFLKLNIDVKRNAHSLITTPAAGKFYRSSGPVARQSQTMRVAPGGILEWFPLENIFFSGANVRIETRVDLSDDSHFISWDIFCLGRPASSERFDQGFLNQRMEICRNGAPLRVDILNAKGGSDFLDAKWGLMGYPVIGNMVCATDNQEVVDLMRDIEVDSSQNELFSVTRTEGIMLCRFLGNSVERAKTIFIKAWKVLRMTLMGLDIVKPRIWNT
jgi:urease accessory protein